MKCKTRDSTRLDYEKEMERLRHLQQERVKQQAIVKHFKNSNEVYYIKIRKTVEGKCIVFCQTDECSKCFSTYIA